MSATPKDILHYWFGKITKADDFPTDHLDLWFKKDEKVDKEIDEKFGHLLSEDLSKWNTEPRSRLAHLIVLDQFPRHIYRNTSDAFKYDEKALPIATDGIQQGFDKELFPIERAFFYMPLQHSEELKIQDLAIKCYRILHDEVSDHVKPMYGEFLKYAVRHRDVIVEFGRFPHRNPILNRPSTPEEEAYLKEEGAGF